MKSNYLILYHLGVIDPENDASGDDAYDEF